MVRERIKHVKGINLLGTALNQTFKNKIAPLTSDDKSQYLKTNKQNTDPLGRFSFGTQLCFNGLLEIIECSHFCEGGGWGTWTRKQTCSREPGDKLFPGSTSAFDVWRRSQNSIDLHEQK